MTSNSPKKTVAVIGLWHLGCTVAASLAKAGHQVTGFDFDKQLIGKLNKATLPIAEAGLGELTGRMIKSGKLVFSNDFRQLFKNQYIIIGYDTPVSDRDLPDLAVIEKAVREIEKYSRPASTVIIMSQIPAGTSRKIYRRLKKKIKGLEVVYNPENLRLSQAIDTYLNADRQILGVSSPKAAKRMKEFYKFYNNPLLFMSLESAELVKHGVNAFLAMSVSFINQLADVSESVGGNIVDTIKGLKSDSRIGQKAFLSPGLGFAGGTLGRDLRVLESLGKANKIKLPLISDVYKINQDRKQVFYKKVTKALGSLRGKKIAMLGLVYKPGTDTLRRSLSLEIAKWLVKQGAVVKGFDPALSNAKSVLPILLSANPYEASKGAAALVIITEWPEFKNLDYKKIKGLMSGKVIFDTKNILDKELIESLGFSYYGTGI
jgi:UDPglucose 6-dehydrogenase